MRLPVYQMKRRRQTALLKVMGDNLKGFRLVEDTVLSEDTDVKVVGRTASRARKPRRRRLEVVDVESPRQGDLTRSKRLILAAVRVWELKRGLRQ